MLTGTQIQVFHGRGFVNGGRLLDDARVDDLREELDRVIGQREAADVRQPVLMRNLSRNEETPIWQIVNIGVLNRAGPSPFTI